METDAAIPDHIIKEVSRPIITYPGYTDFIPELLKQAILKQRTELALAGEKTASDAEVALYLMGASLCFPLDSDWANIYFYTASNMFASMGIEVPPDIRAEEIDSYQKNQLDHLKGWLYQKSVKNSKKNGGKNGHNLISARRHHI